uniref:Glycosyltransferase family 92 protein n=1 Tax=Meloidogyne floridensis TaxID=298350 RepID=A0A915PGP0_9BILA
LERRLFFKSVNPECIYEGNRYLASLESVHEGYSHAPCRLGLFRIVCQLPWIQEPPKNKIGISLRGSPTIKISLKLADSKFRQLIFCPGRMFLFEQWHLFLATMESNKLLGADLIIAHIQSIITELIPLLKIYENEGILQIRSSLRMPDNQKQNLLFNPNEETLWNNQLINFHECLYEFKESAAFIGFPDWDDILISPSAIPFTKGLMDFSMANPQVAAFLPKRYPGQIEILEKLLSRSPTSPIEHLFLESIKFSIWPEDAEFISKIILRPQLVNSVDLHGVGQIIEDFIQSELPENIAFFVHARDFKNERMTAILPPALLLTRNTLLTLQKHNLSSFSSSPLLKKLPKKEKYLNLLNKCLKRKNIEGRVRTQKQSKCFNYAQCKPKIKLQIEDEECLNTDNLWEEIYLPNKHLRIFVLEESRLKIKKICQI